MEFSEFAYGPDYVQDSKPAGSSGESWVKMRTGVPEYTKAGYFETSTNWTYNFAASTFSVPQTLELINGIVYTANDDELVALRTGDDSTVYSQTSVGRVIDTVDSHTLDNIQLGPHIVEKVHLVVTSVTDRVDIRLTNSNGVETSKQEIDSKGIYTFNGPPLDTDDQAYSDDLIVSVTAMVGVSPSMTIDSVIVQTDTNLSPGSTSWSFEYSNNISDIASGGGLVYTAIGSVDQGSPNVVARSADDGSVQWSHALHGANEDGEEVTSGVAYNNGVVYSTAWSGADYDVVAVNAVDGSKNWVSNLTLDDYYSIAVSDIALYIGTNSTIVRVNKSDGTEDWSVPIHNSFINDIAVDEPVVYSCADDGSVAALELNTSSDTTVWKHTHHSSDEVREVAITNGGIVSSNNSGEVIIANRDDGSERHRIDTSQSRTPRVAIDGDKLYTTKNVQDTADDSVIGKSVTQTAVDDVRIYGDGQWLTQQ